MADLQTLRANIEDEVRDTTISTQIDSAINKAIKFYQNTTFWFNQASTNFNTVASQEAYGTSDGFPSDWLDTLLAEIVINTNKIPELEKETFSTVRYLNSGNQEGQPWKYAMFDNELYLTPIPNAVYQVNLYYKPSYSELSNNTDSNVFTDNAQTLIETWATWYIYSRILLNPQKAASVSQMLPVFLRPLIKETNNRLGSGKISAGW